MLEGLNPTDWPKSDKAIKKPANTKGMKVFCINAPNNQSPRIGSSKWVFERLP
jgi:hypothetical protein